jgi:SAM-dependent methyltransferase
MPSTRTVSAIADHKPGTAFYSPGMPGQCFDTTTLFAEWSIQSMTKISSRFLWMVETLPLDPADRVLEVGCGHGIALGLIGERLVTGTITGIDRSAKMIAAATKRNAALVEAGRVRLRTASLHEPDDEPGSYDLICAMNVASFWTQPARDLGAARRLLAPGGALCLFVQLPPWASGGVTWPDDVSTTLADHGFVVAARHHGDVDPYPVACVFARVAA